MPSRVWRHSETARAGHVFQRCERKSAYSWHSIVSAVFLGPIELGSSCARAGWTSCWQCCCRWLCWHRRRWKEIESIPIGSTRVRAKKTRLCHVTVGDCFWQRSSSQHFPNTTCNCQTKIIWPYLSFSWNLSRDVRMHTVQPGVRVIPTANKWSQELQETFGAGGKFCWLLDR